MENKSDSLLASYYEARISNSLLLHKLKKLEKKLGTKCKKIPSNICQALMALIIDIKNQFYYVIRTGIMSFLTIWACKLHMLTKFIENLIDSKSDVEIITGIKEFPNFLKNLILALLKLH